MTSKQKIILVSVLVVVAVILVAVGGYFIAVFSSASGQRTSGGFTYDVDGKTVTIISYTGNDTTVTVPAKIGGRRVAKIAKGAFSSSKATSLVFDDDIAQITFEDECFKGQTTLTYIQLPSALKEIPESCFEDCTALEHIVIPGGVTSIGVSAFEGCTSLTYTGNDSTNKVVTLPSELKTLGDSAFKDCTKISSVKFGGKLQTVSESSFESCTQLSKIDFGTDSAVSKIEEKAFYKTRVNGFTLPDALTSIGEYAFADDTSSSFTTLTIPSSVTIIDDYAFSGCTYLRTVTFAENSEIKNLGEGVFKNCSYLSSITLPDTVTQIPALAFNGCGRLVKFTIGANVEKIGEGAFGGIANLSSSAIEFTVADGNKNFTVVKLDDYYKVGTNGNTAKSHYLLMNADKSELLAYIGQFNFDDCINDAENPNADSFKFLISADISKTLKKIGAYAFSGLRADKLCIPNTVKEIGAGFISGSEVKTVYFEDGRCTLDEKAFDGISGTLRVLGFTEGDVKEFIDALNEEGNNDVQFSVGVNWPD